MQRGEQFGKTPFCFAEKSSDALGSLGEESPSQMAESVRRNCYQLDIHQRIQAPRNVF